MRRLTKQQIVQSMAQHISWYVEARPQSFLGDLVHDGFAVASYEVGTVMTWIVTLHGTHLFSGPDRQRLVDCIIGLHDKQSILHCIEYTVVVEAESELQPQIDSCITREVR